MEGVLRGCGVTMPGRSALRDLVRRDLQEGGVTPSLGRVAGLLGEGWTWLVEMAF